MPLVPAKCPECGGNVVVDNEKDAWMCDFCKTPFIVEKAINNFNTINNITNSVTNNNDIKADVVNVYESKTSEFVVKAGELIAYNGESMDVVIPENVVAINFDVFQNSNIHSIIIHNKVERAGSFSGCDKLEKVKLPDDMRGELPSFKHCKSLKEIVIPDGIERIPSEAFFGCRSLKQLHLPESIKVIGGATFTNCISLERIELPASLDSIGNSVGYGTFEGCESLKEIRLPNCIDRISKRMFYNCKSLEIIDAKQVTHIDEGAFKNCISLKELPFFPKLLGLGWYSSDGFYVEGAFEGCIALDRVTLKGNVEYGANTFRDCSGLSKVEIEGIVRIGDGCFIGCNHLKDIDLERIESIAATAFDHNSIIMKKVSNSGFIPPKSYPATYPYEHWENQNILAKKNAEIAQLASEIFKKRMNNTISMKNNNRKQCPLCGGKLNWRGVCFNDRCASYKMIPIDAVNKMSERIKKGLCPYCGKKLSELNAWIRDDGREILHMRCKNGGLDCRLIYLEGWEN